jgi:ectoine hydroxylase-related dioxygenase (phytanoyl-CoA dioxygenase family)
MSDYLLTDEQIAFYRENGFIRLDNILSPDELDELRQYMNELMSSSGDRAVDNSASRGAYYRVLNQRVNGWRDHGGYSRYAFHPRFAEVARQLTGAQGIAFFHDHALLKMPGDSQPTPWHQDFPYWPMNEPGALSIWVALDDVDENNGCMRFVPGSHKVGKLDPRKLTEETDLEQYAKGTVAEGRTPVTVRLKAGSCTFHNGLTFHYAHANHTDKPRRALAIIYMPEGTTYSGKKHVITDPQGLTPGQPIAGPLHPVLARAK